MINVRKMTTIIANIRLAGINDAFCTFCKKYIKQIPLMKKLFNRNKTNYSLLRRLNQYYCQNIQIFTLIYTKNSKCVEIC